MDNSSNTSLAERYLPCYQFSEKHGIPLVKAPAATILSVLKTYDDRSDRVINFLQAVREFPAHFMARLGGRNALADRPVFGLSDFFPLEETDNEVAFGLIGRFWKLDYGLVKIASTEEYLHHAAPGYGKLVMVWSILPADGGNRLVTETRIFCPDRSSRLKFSLYWVAIRLASGWIRLRILNRLKQEAEHAAQLLHPGA